MIGNTNISDIYMTVLGSMSTKDKLELIAKLSDSISKEKKDERKECQEATEED